MNYKKILIIKLSAIGDVIHALPVASALKKNNPAARITWIVEKPAYDLLTNNPNIDEIILFDKKKLKSTTGLVKYGCKLSKELRSRNFDLALDLQGLLKSAAIAYLSRAKKRLVYCNARELSYLVSEKVCGENSKGHVVDRYLDVVRQLGITIDKPHFGINLTETEIAETKDVMVKAGLNVRDTYVVLAPGTNWPNKCWPTNYFAELAEALYEKGFTPVVIGGTQDERLYNQIAVNIRKLPVNLTGKINLKQLAYVLKNAKAFVGGDTGPMHLAAAVNIPVIALFGPTSPERNGPYGNNHVVLKVKHDCQGCWKRKCPKKMECLADIHPNEVYLKVLEVIGEEKEKFR